MEAPFFRWNEVRWVDGMRIHCFDGSLIRQKHRSRDEWDAKCESWMNADNDCKSWKLRPHASGRCLPLWTPWKLPGNRMVDDVSRDEGALREGWTSEFTRNTKGDFG